MNFETRPITDLPPASKGRGHGKGTSAAFAELPATLALLIPRGEHKTLASVQSSVSAMLKRAFVNRDVHSRIDRTKDGVWFWWEARP